jgi:hypothetical protein
MMNKKGIRQPIITNRICNMCELPFLAKDDMRSCPACVNLKGGEAFAPGLGDNIQDAPMLSRVIRS